MYLGHNANTLCNTVQTSAAKLGYTSSSDCTSTILTGVSKILMFEYLSQYIWFMRHAKQAGVL